MTTLGELLDTCRAVTGSAAELVPLPDPVLLAAGVEPWTHLPLWLPADLAVTAWDIATERAAQTGLVRRTVHESVVDTWDWLRALDAPPVPPRGLPVPGLPDELEVALLADRR